MSLLLLLITCFVAIALVRRLVRKPHRDIPIAGYSGALTSYISCIRFLTDAQRFFDDAHGARTDMFQFRLFHEWRVMVNDKRAISELFDSSKLLFLPTVGITYQFRYTVHPSLENPDIHRPYLRFIMSHLDDFLPDMMTEIDLTLDSRHSENNGKSVLMDCMTEAVFRALNIVLVGPYLARDPVFCKETLRTVQSILATGSILKLSPSCTRPLLHKLLNLFVPTCANSKAHAMMVNEIRRRKSEISKERGHWERQGCDVLAEFARNETLGDDENMLALHFIILNLAGTFSTTMTLTQIVFYLIQQEGCLLRIREELQAATVGSSSGITSGVLASCPSLDTFLKESLRLCNLGVLHITRRAMKDFAFSNGVRVPAGTLLSVPIGWTHHNPQVYPNPETFDDSRFRVTQGDHDHVVHPNSDPSSLNLDFLFFGYGRHACPGRFLAMRIIKCLVAHLVLKYDIRWTHPGFVPRPMWVMYCCVPDPKAEVVISRRGSSQDGNETQN
ncbi:cytochrome P450 [Phlebopus sp. FC_14]|nr:cytochrome P450 [Phlebopus sp. FC_14]